MRKIVVIALTLCASLAFAADPPVYYDGTYIVTYTGGVKKTITTLNVTNLTSTTIAGPLFSGQDTTGSVTSAAADAGKYLKADGTWDDPGAGGGGDVYLAHTNIFTAPTNYFAQSVVISNSLEIRTNLTVSGTATFNGTLTATAAGSVSNALNLGGIAAANYIPSGYISGCWPQYVDTNTVCITNGDGYCYDRYFAITNTAGISVDVSSWSTTAWGYQYFYVDYSDSTFPYNPSIYAATNLPTYDTVHNGWYNSATTQDRLLGAAIQTNVTSALLRFDCNEGLYSFIYNAGVQWGFLLVSAGGSPPTWTATPTASSTYLSVCAKAGYFSMYSEDGNSLTYVGLISAEAASKRVGTPYQYRVQGPVEAGFLGYTYVEFTGRVPLGPSRNVSYATEDDDDNAYIWLSGYEIGR